ncbi:MAG: Zn-ribbon domain-containing OB-fold protein [Myxococcota bacterium]
MSGASALPDRAWEPTRGFWEAAQRRQLAIPRCDDCGAFVWYPADACRRCASAALRWTPVSGGATLYSWAGVSRALFEAFADRAPYLTGLVALDEDPSVRLVTTLVDCRAEELRIDMPVQVVFRTLAFPGSEDSLLAPMFTPVLRP